MAKRNPQLDRQAKLAHVRDMVLEAALDPDLDSDGMTVALGRGLLLVIAEGGTVGAGGVAEVLAASARLKLAGGGVDPLKELREWGMAVDDGLLGSSEPGSTTE